MDINTTRAVPVQDRAPDSGRDISTFHPSASARYSPKPFTLLVQPSSDPSCESLRGRRSLNIPWRKSVMEATVERRASVSLAGRAKASLVDTNSMTVDRFGDKVDHPSSHPGPSSSSGSALSLRRNVGLPTSPHNLQKPVGLRGVLRRVSVSLRSLVHKHAPLPHETPAADLSAPPRDHLRPRMTTSQPAWWRLRQAACFRLSRSTLSSAGSTDSFPSVGCSTPNCCHLSALGVGSDYPHLHVHSPLSPSTVPPLPVPGLAGGPPVIPSNTGAAAKASAAMQNEYITLFSGSSQEILQVSSPVHATSQVSRLAAGSSDDGNDRESGIGIAVTNSEPEQESYFASIAQPSPVSRTAAPVVLGPGISRVDFIANLPLELSIQILAHLNAAALAAVSSVSRRWLLAAANQHVWRDSFLREKTGTFATSGPIRPGAGLGVPRVLPDCDWKEAYRVREELDRRWCEGLATPAYLHGHKDSIYCVQFDEHKIITGSRDKTIRIWDMHTFQCELVIGPPEVLADPGLLSNGNGQATHFAVVDGHRRTGASLPEKVSFPTHHKASILCLQYDDRMLATGSSDGSCIIYNMKDGYKPIAWLRHHTAAVLDLVFDAQHIVTCSKDATICVWERETGAVLRQLRGHTGPVNAVQMRGNTIVSCSGDFRVKLWNIDTGKNIREFVGHTKGLACSQFSEDGRYVASAGNDKTIRVWNANTGECLHGMPAHEGLVRSLHIDSVSGRLVSGGYDADIKVFDLRSGSELLRFPRWHESWVLSAKSDYRRIVSTGQDPKILILDFGADVRGIELLESGRPDDSEGYEHGYVPSRMGTLTDDDDGEHIRPRV